MFFRKAYLILMGSFWLNNPNLFAQDQKIADSLTRIYQQNILTDTAKFKLLSDLAFHETKDVNKGLLYVEELLRLSARAGNKRYMRSGYFLKGNKKRLLGDLDEALEAYFKSAEIAKQIHHLKGEGEAYGAIADIYSVANNHANAMEYYHKGINTLRLARADSTNLASVISNAGDEFLKTKNYDSALLYFDEAKLIFDRINYSIGKGYSLGNIGMVYANIGKDAEAEKNINEAIRILQETQDYYPICVYLISMADIYLNRGDEQTAMNYTSRSLQLAEQHRLKEQIAEAHLKLSNLYQRAGNINEAFKHYKQHIVYRDSVNNINTVQRLADLRTNYEVSQKQLEVNLLNREKRSQQALVISLYIILGLTLLLLVSLFWFYKSKSKEKLRLHQQELLHARLEIQEQTYKNISQELHDNIGQVLLVIKMNLHAVDISDSATRGKLDDSTNLISKVIRDIRDISKSLNTDFLNEIGLPKAVDQQLQLLKRTGLYTTELVVAGETVPYGPERELLVFRVIQELLNNIVKHARADHVDVYMNYETERLIIIVQDNGEGFDVQNQQLNADKGLGLRNIHNRLKLIRGSVFFKTETGNGTSATIEIIK